MARQAGYAITLRLFVPVDQKDIQDTITKAKAVAKAEAGDLSAITDLAEAEITEFKHAFTSRNTGTGRASEEGDSDDGEGDNGGNETARAVPARRILSAAYARH